MHTNRDQVSAALLLLKAQLSAKTIMGSHDDHTVQQRRDWTQIVVSICEFLETYKVVKTAHHLGSPVVMGAPNLLRNG